MLGTPSVSAFDTSKSPESRDVREFMCSRATIMLLSKVCLQVRGEQTSGQRTSPTEVVTSNEPCRSCSDWSSCQLDQVEFDAKAGHTCHATCRAACREALCNACSYYHLSRTVFTRVVFHWATSLLRTLSADGEADPLCVVSLALAVWLTDPWRATSSSPAVCRPQNSWQV